MLRLRQKAEEFNKLRVSEDTLAGELADEIRCLYFNNPQSVQSVLSRAAPDGTVTKFLLDNQGKIIGLFP